MKIIRIAIAMAMTMIACSSVARLFEARREDRLYRGIERSELAIVLFYRESRALRKEDVQEARRMARLVHIFNRASANILFEEGGLNFIRANIERHDLEAAAASFGVADIPTMIIFVEGELLKTAQGKPIMLHGFVSHERLISFINNHLRSHLEKNRSEYRHRQEVRALSGPAVSVGIGLGFPGWGGGYYDPYDYEPYYYYDRPGFGVGIGVGGAYW